MTQPQSPAADSNWKKPFFMVWTAQTFSLIGSGLVQFALVWWLTQTTGSATVLATATFMAVIPDVFLGPFAGALVDRWNRRLVMMVADGAIAAATLALAVLFWSGHIQTWHVYVILFLRSLGGNFHWPAMQASTSLMVPEQHLARVAGLNTSIHGALNIATPPLGALLIGLLPFYGVLSIDIITAILAVGTLFFIRIPQPALAEPQAVVTPRLVLRDVREGFRYVIAWPGLTMILAMAVIINFLLAPAGTLAPLLVTKYFHGGPWHLGTLESAWGVGVVLGGVVLTAWGGFKRRIYTTLSGVVGLSAGIFLIGLAPAQVFAIAIAGNFLSGLMNPIANGPLMAIVQARVAPEMQGRVFTLINSFAAAMVPLSMIVAAPVAEALGVRAWYIIGAALCMLIGAGAFLVPAILHVDDDAPAPLAAPAVLQSVEAE